MFSKRVSLKKKRKIKCSHHSYTPNLRPMYFVLKRVDRMSSCCIVVACLTEVSSSCVRIFESFKKQSETSRTALRELLLVRLRASFETGVRVRRPPCCSIMSGHGHGHGHGGHGHGGGGHGGHGGHGHGGCEGEHEPAERGLEYGLYQRIDTEKLQCLNESREGDGKLVFKAWDQRTDRERFVESDADEELLFNIPFTGSVKLKGIIISGEDDQTHPAEIRLYKNIPHMSFDDVGREPDQAFRLNRDPEAQLEYPTKIARFSNVNHLSIHVSKNFGTETTRVYYIGLRGEFSEAYRHEVTICNYEASANPADHRVDTFIPQTNFIS